MSVRSVVRIPARVLKRPAEPVGADLHETLVVDLIDTMRASPASVGLAAPQIGVSKRVIVVDVTMHPKATVCHGLTVVGDPVVIHSPGRKVGRKVV